MTRPTVAQPDVTLLLDMDGIIREASVSNSIDEAGVDAWLGRPWIETIADTGIKVRQMVDDARSTGISAFRQVTQRFPSGRELPIEYTTVLLGGRAGLLAIGKNLQAVAELQSRLVAAQQAMERDYWKLRDIETRYRLLFQSSAEAVLLLKASNLRIIDANPAAVAALELPPRRPDGGVGRDFLTDVSADERDTLQAMLQHVRDQGKAPGIVMHFGRDRKAWLLRASLMPGQIYFLQLSAIGATAQRAVESPAPSIDDLIERMPDGFAVIDHLGVIQRVNQAFVDMVELGTKASAVGERLGRWMSRPGADVNVLLATLQRQRAVRLFATTLHGELGTEMEIEVAAAHDEDVDGRHIVLLIRDVARRLPSGAEANRLIAALGPLSEQVGKTSLRKLVRDTIDVVERHYVRAALDQAGGNRTAAAHLLGLSRQSLYAKLNRYELHGSAETEPKD
ncbi:MAG: transcriptional regulator PpsR [Xanthobacteraceae bacterium]